MPGAWNGKLVLLCIAGDDAADLVSIPAVVTVDGLCPSVDCLLQVFSLVSFSFSSNHNKYDRALLPFENTQRAQLRGSSATAGSTGCRVWCATPAGCVCLSMS